MAFLKNITDRLKKSRLFTDSFWALFGGAFGKGLSLISGIAIARFLGSELYGEYGTIKNTLLMIAIFSSLGLGYSATKFIAENLNSGNKQHIIDTHRIAFVTTLIFSVIIAILLIIFANQVSIWLEAPHIVYALRLSSIAVIFNAVNTTQSGELAGFGAYKDLAKNNIWAGIVTFLLSVILTYFYSLNGAIVALILSLLFNAILNHISLRHCLREYDKKIPVERSYILRVIKYSLPIALQESLYSLTHWINIFILIKFAGYAELGISSAATQWMSVVLFIPGALRNVALSHLSSSNVNKERNRDILKRLMLVNFVATFVPFLLITVLSGYIETWYGNTFNGLSLVLSVCVFTAVINSQTNILTQEYMAYGKNWFLFFSKFLRDVVISATMYWAIPYFGHGALTSALIGLIFQFIYFVLLFYVLSSFNK